jgi:acetolactate synthase-1/2/3 large subunit
MPTVFGSDLILKVLTRLDIRHVALNPGATLRGIHESLMNGDYSAPEPISCLHEGVAVGMAHGYFKASDRLMGVGLHDTVGLLNASMAIFNAWVDRTAILMLTGTGPLDAEHRRPWIDWIHTVGDQGEIVRHMTVWNDQPASVDALLVSIQRAIQTAVGPPGGPALVSVDLTLQETRATAASEMLHLVQPPMRQRIAPDPRAVDAVAAILRTSHRPLIVTDRPLRAEGSQEVVRLAERVGAGLYDLGQGGNVPVGHPNDVTDAVGSASGCDLLLCVDTRDVGLVLQRLGRPAAGSDHELTIVNIGVGELGAQSWLVPNSRPPKCLYIRADPALAIGALTDASTTASRRTWSWHAARQAEESWLANVIGPASIAHAAAEATAGRDVLIAHGTLGGWVRRAFRLQRPDQHIGRSGGEGLGYALPATLGAALAMRGSDRFVIGFQTDGDLLYLPQALWTAAHHQLPVLLIVENNRGYGRDAVHQRHAAAARGRSEATAVAGVRIDDPPVGIAALARSMGVSAFGPISSASGLAGTFRAAVEIIDAGEPALVEVLTEPV